MAELVQYFELDKYAEIAIVFYVSVQLIGDKSRRIFDYYGV